MCSGEIYFVTALVEPFVLGGSRSVPVGLRWGCFTGGEGKASSMQGVEVWVWARVCVAMFAVCVCVCVWLYSRREQKAQVRDTVRKDMHDLLTAFWCVCCLKKVLCNWNQQRTNVGLCVYLPRSKNFLDSHPFQRKHCIRPIYICNRHKHLIPATFKCLFFSASFLYVSSSLSYESCR